MSGAADLVWLLYRVRGLLSAGSRLGDSVQLEPVHVEHQRKLLVGVSASVELLADPQQLLTDGELISALESRGLVSAVLQQVPESALYGELARRGHLMLETDPEVATLPAGGGS